MKHKKVIASVYRNAAKAIFEEKNCGCCFAIGDAEAEIPPSTLATLGLSFVWEFRMMFHRDSPHFWEPFWMGPKFTEKNRQRRVFALLLMAAMAESGDL